MSYTLGLSPMPGFTNSRLVRHLVIGRYRVQITSLNFVTLAGFEAVAEIMTRMYAMLEN